MWFTSEGLRITKIALITCTRGDSIVYKFILSFFRSVDGSG